MRIALAALLLVAACSSGPGHREWTCAAYCVTEYNCSSDGNSAWDASVVISKGDTAAAAFLSLAAQCKDAANQLVTHFQCNAGHDVADGATIASSCAAD